MFTITSKGVARQLAVASTASISLFIIGMLNAWSAPTLKKLREPNAPFHLTPSEEAIVINGLYFTTMLSPLPCGVLMNRVGRKTALLILTIFPIASWVLIYFSNSASMLFVARLCAGFWAGGSPTILPIYIAEIAEPQVRGLLGTFYMGRIQALAWLRGGAPIDSELTTIQTSIEKEAQEGQGYFTKMISLITVPLNRKIMAIVQVMTLLDRFGGLMCLVSFSTVLLPAHLGPLTNDHCTLILGIGRLLASLICSALIDRVGRKPLLYMSSIGSFVTMLPTAAWYYFDRETSTDVSGYNWVPFAGFFLFGVTYSVGLGPIMPILIGEMFPSNLKGEASAITTMNSAVTCAIIIALFVKITIYVGVYVNFLIFAAVGLITLVFTYIYVVETKGKTLQIIQAELRGENRKNVTDNGRV